MKNWIWISIFICRILNLLFSNHYIRIFFEYDSNIVTVQMFIHTFKRIRLKKKKYLRVMGIRRASLIDVRSCWQALHNSSWGIPSWRRILSCRYSVMVTLAHFGQIPPMGIHILTLLRFSLAYHPFHTRCDTVLLLVLRFFNNRIYPTHLLVSSITNELKKRKRNTLARLSSIFHLETSIIALESMSIIGHRENEVDVLLL